MTETTYWNDILAFFARGILEQEQAIDRGEAESVMKLNHHISRAWEQLSFHCWNVGVVPPRTVPELVAWLHQPPAEWQQASTALAIDPNWTQPLLENGASTAFVDTLASPLIGESQPRLALDDAHFRRLHQLCREMGDAEQYSSVRTFLIRNAVVEDIFADVMNASDWKPSVRGLLRECYEPIPNASIRTFKGVKQFAICPHCGWILQWKRQEAVCHMGGACKTAYGDLSRGAAWKVFQDGMMRTKEGIQRFVVAPEVQLVKLYDDISTMHGVICTLFPEFDAYDLQIRWGGGTWAVDFKDQWHPARLARRLTPFARYPQWDRAFYVFPDHRASPSYMNTFKSHWRTERGVQVKKLSAFKSLVRKEIAP